MRLKRIAGLALCLAVGHRWRNLGFYCATEKIVKGCPRCQRVRFA